MVKIAVSEVPIKTIKQIGQKLCAWEAKYRNILPSNEC